VREPATLLLALVLGGCASFGAADRDQAAAAASDSERRLAALAERAARTEVELTLLREKVTALEAEIAQLRSRPRDVVTPPLPPPVVEAPLGPPPTSSRIEEDELAEPPPSPPAPAAAVPAPPLGGAGTRAPVTAAAQALYDRAYATLHQGRYAEAEALFGEYLASWAATDLGDNAWFWIGESRLERGLHNEALVAFGRVWGDYPEGNKVADALLKAGECQELLGDLRAARQLYERLTREQPGAPAASTAAERLQRLD
jgi:tol-pal system protein YbgF